MPALNRRRRPLRAIRRHFACRSVIVGPTGPRCFRDLNLRLPATGTESLAFPEDSTPARRDLDVHVCTTVCNDGASATAFAGRTGASFSAADFQQRKAVRRVNVDLWTTK